MCSGTVIKYMYVLFLFNVQPASPSQGLPRPCRPSYLDTILDKDEEGEDEDELEIIDLGPRDSHPIQAQKSM